MQVLAGLTCPSPSTAIICDPSALSGNTADTVSYPTLPCHCLWSHEDGILGLEPGLDTVSAVSTALWTRHVVVHGPRSIASLIASFSAFTRGKHASASRAICQTCHQPLSMGASASSSPSWRPSPPSSSTASPLIPTRPALRPGTLLA